MEPKDFGSKRAELEARMGEAKIRKAQALDDYTTELANYLSSWYEAEAHRAVTVYHPEAAVKVEEEGIKALREKVRAQTAVLPEMVSEAIQGAPEGEWQGNIETIMNRLGPILERYGLVKPDDDSPWDYAVQTSRGVDDLRYNLSRPLRSIPETNNALQRYLVARDSIDAVRRDLKHLDYLEAQAQAEQLWTKADNP